jgi:hypothetical protein
MKSFILFFEAFFLLRHFNKIFIDIRLIDITLLEKKDTRLEFSRIETPQKNLYLKLASGCKGAMEV